MKITNDDLCYSRKAIESTRESLAQVCDWVGLCVRKGRYDVALKLLSSAADSVRVGSVIEKGDGCNADALINDHLGRLTETMKSIKDAENLGAVS